MPCAILLPKAGSRFSAIRNAMRVCLPEAPSMEFANAFPHKVRVRSFVPPSPFSPLT